MCDACRCGSQHISPNLLLKRVRKVLAILLLWVKDFFVPVLVLVRVLIVWVTRHFFIDLLIVHDDATPLGHIHSVKFFELSRAW